MRKVKNNWFWYLLIVVLVLALLKQCGKKGETIVKTKIETKYIERVDTINTVTIKEIPKKVYVVKETTIKGKDSIVYVDKETNEAIEANQYDTKLESNNATADLKITTTGELLDVTGSISYQEKETTIKETIKKDKSGLFLYVEGSVQPVLERFELGLDYQIRNKIIIGTSASYNNVSKSINFNAKVGIKLF